MTPAQLERFEARYVVEHSSGGEVTICREGTSIRETWTTAGLERCGYVWSAA